MDDALAEVIDFGPEQLAFELKVANVVAQGSHEEVGLVEDAPGGRVTADGWQRRRRTGARQCP